MVEEGLESLLYGDASGGRKLSQVVEVNLRGAGEG